MFEVISYLLCLDHTISSTLIRQLSIISKAMLCSRGRITMLELSRWSGKGGSYRSIRRFYHSKICWLSVNWAFFKQHRLKDDGIYLIAGDETTVSKSGKSSYGLGKFFSSIHSRAIKGLGFFSLCLIEVQSRKTSPLLMEQLEPDMKRRVKPPKASKKAGRGRPVGSKNRNRKNVELTEYLLWIQTHIKRTLSIIGDKLKITYFVYDGAFGNNECLQMVKMCGLSLISKLQCNSALYFPYEGEYKGRGPRRKYGDKVNYQQIPEKYLQQISRKDGIEEKIYQMTVRHKDFADPLNVTIIQRIRLSDKKRGQVVLFSDDLQLGWENMILYYRLRFQIEFTFRDAKQFWGLEDFMNIKQKAVKNAANLSLFMVNLSRFLIDQDETYTQSILDLKSRSQAAFYAEKIIKFNPEIQKIISFEQLQAATADFGCIHPRKIAV